MNCKTIGMKLTAAALTALFVMQNPVQTLRAAAANPQYLCEMIISYGNTDDEAKNWLKENGYQIVDQNLNQDAEGGSSAFSWLGLASTKRSVYLGYRTTTNPDDAITDMKIMNMNGGYSYQAYEKLLDDRKSEITEIVNDTVCALEEYRANYKKGVTKAVIAHDSMNLFSDDDSDDALLGDLLLKPIKQEMSDADYNAAPNEHLDFITLLMQGNSHSAKLILSELAYAADTSADSWLDRLSDVNSYTDLLRQYEKEAPGKSMEDLDNIMIRAYDDKAKLLAVDVNALRLKMLPYTTSDVFGESDEDEILAYAESLSEADREAWADAAALYLSLEQYDYNGGTLAEFLTDAEADYINDTETRQELYPLLDVMSEGQRAMLEYTTLEQMLTSAMLGEDGWKQTLSEMRKMTEGQPVMSAYEGIDRSVFQPDGIALTNEAIRMQSSSQGSAGSALNVGAIAAVWATAVILDGVAAAIAYSSFAKIDTAFTAETINSINQSTASYQAMSELTVLADDSLNIYTSRMQEAVNDVVSNMNQSTRAAFEAVPKGEQVNWLSENLTLTSLEGENADDLFQQFQKTSDEYYKALDSIDADIDYYKGNLREANISNTINKIIGVGFCVAIVLMTAFAVYLTFNEYNRYYHIEMKPIPRVIVSQNEDVLTNYYAVRCNRDAQGMSNKALSDYGDLNGDVMKQWLALYTTKDKDAGKPILADFTVKKGTASVPMNTVPLSAFGSSSALNLVDESYVYNDKVGGIYLYYRADAGTGYTATVTSGGMLAVTGVLSAAAGAGLYAGISALVKRKKKIAAV